VLYPDSRCLDASNANPVEHICNATPVEVDEWYGGFFVFTAIANTATFLANALRAGLPENQIVLNPRALGGTFVVQDKNWTRYNGLQVDLRRRLAQGLLVGANYTYGIRKSSSLQTLAYDRITVDSTDVPHALKLNWHYEVPVGRGRRFGSNMNAIADALIGNWEFSGNGRVQSQRYRMVGVKLEGMSVDELQKNFKIRTSVDPVSGVTKVFSFPQDIIDNTWAAFSTDPTTPTGYSLARGVPTGRYIRPASGASCSAIYRYDCNAPDINLNGPLFSRWDMRIKKRFPFGNRVNIELMAEVLNVFDNINFNHNTDFDDGEDTFRVTPAYTDINTTFDPGGRIGQLVWRISCTTDATDCDGSGKRNGRPNRGRPFVLRSRKRSTRTSRRKRTARTKPGALATRRESAPPRTHSLSMCGPSYPCSPSRSWVAR